MLNDLQYGILMRFFSRSPQRWNESVYQGKSKLSLLFEDKFLGSVAGKTVIDFGCGEGLEAIDIAERGARRVIGLDSREDILQTARGNAAAAGVGSTCLFATSTREFADLVISIDAFEHFDRPAEVLDIMNQLLSSLWCKSGCVSKKC
jgi:2-polyprenyl-3-methyl-5-hydroxy-6-metoxy-1,4-benzoquinol methylase